MISDLHKLADLFARDHREDETPLGVLYQFYAEFVAKDTEITRSRFQSLEVYIDTLPYEAQNAVMDALCAVCTEQEKAAFIHGTRLGVKLMQELSAE
ncbi:MAG: hypothetical protein IJX72_03060 [Clostridia bacterium]|nr:hypothetical protein [Clostridia bacterium]